MPPERATMRESTAPPAAPGSFRRQLVTVVLLVLAVSALHYETVTTLPLLHDVYRRLYYIPVGLAAVWFGVRGGLVASAAVAALYAPHILLHWQHMGREIANQFMEIVQYFAFSALIGHFADQERRHRRHSEEIAEKLEDSYQELRRQADMILEIEGQLRSADRLAAVGELAATITHEIRNPLSSIRGAVEILKDDFPAHSPKAEFFEILLKETDRLDKVVEEYLGLARSKAAEEPTAIVDLGDLARQTAALVGLQTQKRGVRLTTEILAPLPVKGNPVHLKQVLLNLLLNAVQVTQPGGEIRVRGGLREGLVKGLEYRDVEGRLVEVVVEDEGPGIPETDLAKVFAPFYTTRPEGTGLGLAISLRLAEAHGGTLKAENRPGGGTRFVLSLPAAPAETEEIPRG
ncbi:MAG: two-component system sensor histidine kinase NtrB [Candidatus Methylomirabilia bacterium]